MGLTHTMPPHDLQRERDTLLLHISDAFRSVTRNGGVSWSESVVIDRYGSDEESLEARATDKEKGWADLVDDPDWDPCPGLGGFSFLDAIGFRYYLAPAMMRCVRSGHDEGIRFHLNLCDTELRSHMLEQWSALDRRQCLCIARFLRYMIAACANREEPGYKLEREWWQVALDSHWATFR